MSKDVNINQFGTDFCNCSFKQFSCVYFYYKVIIKLIPKNNDQSHLHILQLAQLSIDEEQRDSEIRRENGSEIIDNFILFE